MTNAEQLLATLEVNEVATNHIVIGNDKYVVVPSELKRIAVATDHNVKTVTFDCPRYADGLDMSKMKVFVNYMRSNGTAGAYHCDKVTIDPTDSSIMHFDWTISNHATACKGTLIFLVCIKKVDVDGTLRNHWNSERNSEMTISEGLEADEQIIDQFPDIITQLLVRMDVVEGTAVVVTGEQIYKLMAEDESLRKAITKEQTDRQTAITKEQTDRQTAINSAVATEKSERQNEIAVERARLDNFTSLPNGSTSGDAELADIRVGADGKVYPNAGTAVREQVGKLSEEIDAVNRDLINYSDGVYNYTNLKFILRNRADGVQENRIWFGLDELQQGTLITIEDHDYDVGVYIMNEDEITTTIEAWGKSVVVQGEYNRFCIRKNDKSDISGLTQEYINSIVTTFYITPLKQEIDYIRGIIDKINLEQEAQSSGKYAHFSFDDCTFWANLIDNANAYVTVFENPFLGALKELHEKHGATFTLFTFNNNGTHDISDVPDKFAGELGCCNWLKFGFHGESGSGGYYTDKVEEITASYNKFVDAIYKMCGTTDSIDRVVRLTGFSGTLANVKAIRDCSCGIVGLMTADDTRNSYYLSTEQNDYILNHNVYFDSTNQIMMIKSQPRLDNIPSISYLSEKEYGNSSRYVELFAHETVWRDDLKNAIDNYCVWLKSKGYNFGFAQTVLRI